MRGAIGGFIQNRLWIRSRLNTHNSSSSSRNKYCHFNNCCNNNKNKTKNNCCWGIRRKQQHQQQQQQKQQQQQQQQKHLFSSYCLDASWPLKQYYVATTTQQQQIDWFGAASIVFVATAAAALACSNSSSHSSTSTIRRKDWFPLCLSVEHTTRCEGNSRRGRGVQGKVGFYLVEGHEGWEKLSEQERFADSMKFHQMMLDDYKKRWLNNPEQKQVQQQWPRNIPDSKLVARLEFDLNFYERSLQYFSPQTEEEKKLKKLRIMAYQELKFRVASYLLLREQDIHRQKKGYRLVKQLAEDGHCDAMCLYGIVLNEGKVAGIDPNPKLAVYWWKRCIDTFEHVPSIYEYAVALYTGEGIAEDTEFAVEMFVKAANSGHAGAAFMLGECLLDGVGESPDRGSALEWLVDAAELGHRTAQIRVIAVLERNYDFYKNNAMEESIRVLRSEDTFRWEQPESDEDLSLERKFSIGGGSRNPKVLARRLSILSESRKGQ